MVTIFLGQVFGWYLLIIGVFMLVKSDTLINLVRDATKNFVVIYIVGIFTLIAGIILVISHNIWVLAWPVIITLIAWLTLLSALLRIFLPEIAVKVVQWFGKKSLRIKVTAVINIILGLILLSHIYLK